MSKILLPENPSENDILTVSATRKFKRIGNAWLLFTNNIPDETGMAYPFKPPLFSPVAPPLPNNNPFWQNAVTDKLFYQHFDGTNYQWVQLEIDVPDIRPIVSADAPALPNTNGFWQSSTDGKLYYQHVNGTAHEWKLVHIDQVPVIPIVAAEAPTLPNVNPFWQNSTDGKLYYQKFTDTVASWEAVFVQVAQTIVTAQDTAPALPHSVPFWHQNTTGILYFQKTVAGTTTWQAVNAFDKYDLKVTNTTGAADASGAQVFKIDNSTATTKTINITNAPANRAAVFLIKITGTAGTIAYTNAITWDGGSPPSMGTTFTVIALFWDGTAFTGNASQKS